MKEASILKISIITSIIGVLILLFIADKLEIKNYNISEINEDMLDQEVKVIGSITSIKETPGLYILDIKDSTGEITIVIFKEEPLNLTKNKEIEILGTVTKYKNQIQIQAKQINV